MHFSSSLYCLVLKYKRKRGMDMTEKSKDLFELIHSAEAVTNEAIMRWNEEFKHPLGISPILVLAELKRKGPQNSMKLAEGLHFTGGAMTNIGNKLVKLELVERLAVEGDRRQTKLSITEAGERVLEEATQLGRKHRLELFSILSEQEVEQYLAINQKLLTVLRERKQGTK